MIRTRLKAGLTLLAFAIALLAASEIWAQTVPVPSNNQSRTITTTNTFQSIQAQNNGRIGCAIQNNASTASGDLMYVFFDNTNSASCSAATTGRSVVLQPGQSVSCTVAYNIVLKDQVCITGTSGDAFFANFQ